MTTTSPIIVSDHDPAWPARFEAIQSRLAEALGPSAVGIEHVGSTAVAGLAAQPIIDVDVALADYSSAHELRPALEAAGFVRARAGDLGDRQLYVLSEAGRRVCQLSLTFLASETWRSHLALRDRLRLDPEARQAYGDLKRGLAARHSDQEAYARAKAGFVESLPGFGPRPARLSDRISRRGLLIAGLALGGLAAVVAAVAAIGYFIETSKGSDGLPDHRAVRATDLASRPEATLFYPGSAVLVRATSDQGSDPANPASTPAEVDTLLVTPAAPEKVSAWYAQSLAGRGWVLSSSSLTRDAPAGELASEWLRGRREYFDLRLYVDRATLGSQGYAVQGLIYRVVYLVRRGP